MCEKVYIGENKRHIKTRLKEYKEACRGQSDKTAIAEHAWMEDHPIDWDGTKVLQVMKEALCIQAMHTCGLIETVGMS